VTATKDHIPKKGGLLNLCLVIASLYWARDILMPIALAVFFAFVLEPLSKYFEKAHLGRVSSALAAVLFAILTAGVLSYCVAGQFGEFAVELPKYEKTIHEKLQKMKVGSLGVFGHAEKSIQDFRKDLTPTNSATSPTNSLAAKNAIQGEIKPVPVELRSSETSTLQIVRSLIGPSLNFAVTLFLVTIFCIFILAGRDDLRARLSEIVGTRNIKLTNHLLKETAERVSRYLVMQLIVNISYGFPIGLGLWIIGIPNPLLWGMIAAVFRYIPYAGPWIAALLPFAVGFAIGSDWSKPLLVVGLFGVVEIITANLVEPWLYGSTTGITPLAVLLAAVFWTWLWGPVGLLLSMPLTVCLVSIARYVPQLELLDQLFGETKKDQTKLE
jgi:predicted PurR-regulated permease PerM